jgi:hypothetical protein
MLAGGFIEGTIPVKGMHGSSFSQWFRHRQAKTARTSPQAFAPQIIYTHLLNKPSPGVKRQLD